MDLACCLFYGFALVRSPRVFGAEIMPSCSKSVEVTPLSTIWHVPSQVKAAYCELPHEWPSNCSVLEYESVREGPADQGAARETVAGERSESGRSTATGAAGAETSQRGTACATCRETAGYRAAPGEATG